MMCIRSFWKVLIMTYDSRFILFKRDSKTDDKTRLERLERLTNNKTIFVKTIDDLGSFLRNLLIP